MKFVLDEKIVISQNAINTIIHGTCDSRSIAAKTSVKADRLLDREISFLKHIEHPNIVRYTACFISDGRRYMIMELAQGNLFQHLGLKEFTTARKRSVVEQISSGLQYIHSLNMVHRDLKPTNILLMDSHRVVISDFAMAQRCDLLRHETNKHDIVQDEDYTFKSDVFLLGLLAFQIFADKKNIDRTWRILGAEIEEAFERGDLEKEIFTKRIWAETVVDSVNQHSGKRPTATRFHGAFIA